jgi:hypothetical protein
MPSESTQRACFKDNKIHPKVAAGLLVLLQLLENTRYLVTHLRTAWHVGVSV